MLLLFSSRTRYSPLLPSLLLRVPPTVQDPSALARRMFSTVSPFCLRQS